MPVADVTEIVFEAFNKNGKVIKVQIVVPGYCKGYDAVKQCRKEVERSDKLDEYMLVLRVTHIQVPVTLLPSLPLVDIGEDGDTEQTRL